MRLFSSMLLAAALAASSSIAAAQDHPAAGTIAVTGPWTRATPPGAPVAGGFLTLRNGGGAEDRLTGGSTPAAQRVEIHEMAVTDGVMTMRPLPDGLVIPAGGEVALKPGAHHLMLIGLKAPLRQGDHVPLTLIFEKAGRIDLELSVEGIGAKQPGSAPEGHGAMHGGVKP